MTGPRRAMSENALNTILAQRMAYNGSGQIEYMGEAPAGSTDAQAAWRIKKFVYSGGVQVKTLWADGDDKFNNVWDNGAGTTYASLSYS